MSPAQIELQQVKHNVEMLEKNFTPNKSVSKGNRVFVHDPNGGLHIYYVGQDQLND